MVSHFFILNTGFPPFSAFLHDFISSDQKHDVMLMSQSTTVLANRLTQVALYPQEYTYVIIAFLQPTHNLS